MQTSTRNYRRLRLLRLAAGVTGLFIVVARMAEHPAQAGGFTAGSAFIWAAACMAIVLLVWREKNQSRTNRLASEEHKLFVAAAETSPDAFFIFDAVRDPAGAITDFRFIYVNSHGEELLKTPRARLLNQDLCALFPGYRARGSFEKYCEVAQTGKAMSEEFSNPLDDGSEMWLRARVTRLGDGIAITTSDATEVRAKEERYKSLSSLSKSVFENAPFSIVEMDLNGMIQQVNSATERLTGYRQADLIGTAVIELLQDSRDPSLGPSSTSSADGSGLQRFALLTNSAKRGEVEQRESTFKRSDGSTLPVLLAVTAVRNAVDEISGFVAIASDISERKQMINYLGHMASHDQLTGLPGRKLLRERIAEAIEKALLHERKVAVFVIDLDHFKRLNDSLGHKAGDEVLVGMADRMRQSLRRSDTLGRLGGDEFVVIMPHIATLANVERCAKRLVERVSSTAMVGDLEVNLTASIGVCVFPDFAGDVDSLLERADAAAYAAKENGRNQYKMFADTMMKASQDRLSMETALRHALAREEMYLHYQPIVSISTGRVVGLEALLRWLHPKLGPISPGAFIPLAEETGLIVPIGEWAMKRSCIDGKLLSDQLGINLCISVNLSPRQFEQSSLLRVIEDSLEASGLQASQLQVELTENTLMINSASNLEKLQQIRQMGARVAIDDFGTGFCSFSYLLQYPVDRLKIDQSFIAKSITEPNAATVVRTIVAMSHHLGVKVVAEGIEMTEQLEFLERRHCDEAQGFYLSRPVAFDKFGAAVDFIHRLFEERALHNETTHASGTGGVGSGQASEGEIESSTFDTYDEKQIVM